MKQLWTRLALATSNENWKDKKVNLRNGHSSDKADNYTWVIKLLYRGKFFHCFYLVWKDTNHLVCSVRHSFHCRIKYTNGKVFNRTFLTFPIRIYHFILIYLEHLFQFLWESKPEGELKGKKNLNLRNLETCLLLMTYFRSVPRTRSLTYVTSVCVSRGLEATALYCLSGKATKSNIIFLNSI